MRTRHAAVVIIALICIDACGKGRLGPSPSTRVTAPPRAIDQLSVDERLDILRRAQVWRPIDTATLDLRAGPVDKESFGFDQAVPCTYVFPQKPLSGLTPKFNCAVARDDTVKVKYGRDNGEVYAEVAASRLFWALGFAVDRMYPVRVMCRDCPPDPFKESKQEWHLGRTSKVSDVTFDPAAIEREFPGKSVEVPGYEGWAWPELQHVDEEAGGAPRAHIEALELLAVFVQHVDSKPEQQAIKCANKDIGRDSSGNATCAAPVLVVKDLGSSFGRAKRLRFDFDKMRYDSWRRIPIWRDDRSCVGRLTRSILGSLEDPPVSEAGRQFLADRLMQLRDEQIRDLFVAARIERRGDTTRDPNGRDRPVTVEDWVQAFKEKREQVVARRCG